MVDRVQPVHHRVTCAGCPATDRVCRVAGLASHLAVEAPHRERGEDRDDDRAAQQRPADVPGHRAVVGEVTDGRDDQADGVDVGEGPQPRRHRVGGHERVGQEGQREHHHQRDPLHALGRLADRAEPGEDPGQRPAGEHRQQDGAEDAEDAAARPVAHREAGGEGQRRRDRVADQVGDHRTRERGDARDRQHLEPVEDALVHVLAQLHAGGDAGGEDGLADQAGDDERQVVLDAAADRAAEDVGEHRGEQQRLDGHVEELLEVAPHLHRRAPGHRAGLRDGLRE